VSEHGGKREKREKERERKNEAKQSEGEPMAEKGLIWPSVLVFLKVRARGNTSTFSVLPSFPSPITSRASSGPPPYLRAKRRRTKKNEEAVRGDDGRGDGGGESTKSRKNVIST
jgi:hypothetical protein